MLARACPKGRKRKQTTDVQITVIKQSGYSDNLTALHIKMKSLIQYYSSILGFLNPKMPEILSEEVARRLWRAAIDLNPSWVADEESLKQLNKCVNNSDTAEQDWLDTIETFLIDMFKDLSILKNPEAMELFHQICRRVLPLHEDCFLWARNIKKRKDGSAVIVLHVSNLEMFEKALKQPGMTRTGDLETGALMTT